MDFWLSGLKVPLLAVATAAMVLSAGAQPTGQSIVFSTPQDDSTPSVTPPSSTTDSSHGSELGGAYEAPSFFNFSAPNDLPMPSRGYFSQPVRKSPIEHKGWTQMTAAEMFGVAPADDKNTTGQPDSPTPLDQYFNQQKQAADNLRNGGPDDQSTSPWDFPRTRDDGDNSGQNPNRFFGSRWNATAPANQNGSVSWDSFSTPALQTMAKPNLEQQAAMERFRQLLESSPVPAAGTLPDKLSTVPTVTVDPNLTQPAFVPNPAGTSFTPLSSGIGTPAGLTPLPGIVTPVTQPAATPSWAPQPAPWLSSAPQPFVIPQRKF
jgi:hypothetical protein